MKIQLILVLVLCCLYSQSDARKLSRRGAAALQAKRQVAAAAPVETPAEALMRLKLLTYTEKLKAKEAKKQAKAQKKAAKDAAFASYMGSLLAAQQAAATAPPSPGVAGVGPAPAAAAAAPVPPMPMIPALGLWRKSFILSQIASAVAAAATTTTVPPPLVPALEATTAASPTPASEDSGEDADEDATINEIVKRYAPALRKKMYGSDSPYDKYNKKNSDADEDEDTDDEEDETLVPNYKKGSFNKFGSGPSGSPNGVGYDQGKINQAGCSGNHIHICSGTTVYLTSPEEDALQELELAVGEDEGEDEDTAPGVSEEEQGQKSKEESSNEKPKHGSKKQKHGHGRSH